MEDECKSGKCGLCKKSDQIKVGEVKLGAQQTCPKCGALNKSGLSLPEDCRMCSNQLVLPGFQKPVKC